MPDTSATTLQLPTLPDTAAVTRNPGGFAMDALGLMAALASSDGRLLEDEFSVYIRAAGDLVGATKWRDPLVQLAAFGLLDAPPSVEDALAAFGRHPEVARDARARAAESVLGLLEHTPQIARSTGMAHRALMALGDRDTDRLRRAEAVDAAAVAATASWSPSASWLASNKARANHDVRATCGVVRWLAGELGDSSLERAVADVERMLDHQPYRIVLVGEVKHGKSSLFNAIAGRAFSPVGETRATTAAVLELGWARDVQLGGRWLTADKVERLVAGARTLAAENEDLRSWLVGFEGIRSAPWFVPGGTLPTVSTVDELRDYLAADGEYAVAVERVTLSLPVPSLESGVILVDTPGLNDTIRVRGEITLEEAYRADCTIVVLHGLKLGTESERRFLTDLMRKGRAVHVVPVVTHGDLLSSDEARRHALDEAQRFVEGCVRGSPVHVYQGVLIDARMAQEDSTSGNDAAIASALSRFREALARAIGDPDRGGRSDERVKHALGVLLENLKAAGLRWRDAHEARLPTPSQLEERESLAQALDDLAEEHRTHVERQLVRIRERLHEDHDAYLKSISYIKADLLDVVRARVDSTLKVGRRDRAAWDAFDQRFADEILRPRLDRFDADQRDWLRRWDKDAVAYRASVADETHKALERLRVGVDRLEGLTATHARGWGVLLDAKDIVDGVNRRVTSAGGGFLAGTAAVGGWGILSANVIALIGAAAAVPGVGWAIGVAAVGAATVAWTAFSLLPEGMFRTRILEQKVHAASKRLDGAFADKADMHARIVAEVWDKAFVETARTRYAPIIASALAMAGRARVQRRLWERIRSDGRALAADLAEGRLSSSPSRS